MLNKPNLENLTNEIWKGAIKLRGKFKAKDYPSVILPIIMIRRIEQVLIEKRKKFENQIKSGNPDIDKETLKEKVKILEKNEDFYNKGDWTIKDIIRESPAKVEDNFREYLSSFSDNIKEIIEKFDYFNIITKMVKEKRLSSILRFVAEEDFSPKRISNLEMGYVYEELLQRFSQDDAKDTGEHFTPREIIRIMVDLMDIRFDATSSSPKAIKIYDPACGTGGMLSVSKEHLLDKAKTDIEKENVKNLVVLNGQEYLSHNYAVCKADMLLKGETDSFITQGNSLIPNIESIEDDGDFHANSKFDYMLSNPPFGVDWSDYHSDVLRFKTSRFKWGLPPKNDGALLFLMTMIDKMKPANKGGSKIAILFNGSPLSNGDATQGESEIRRNILENDLLETIVMLPDQMFYNTGIYTYIWLLNNNKPASRKNKVLIINARSQFEKEPKSFGNKRNRITNEHRQWIQNKYNAFTDDEECHVFDTTDFAFHKVEVVFWQEDEKGEQMWITEPFDVQLNNNNVKKRFERYGDMTFFIDIENPYEKGKKIKLIIDFDGETPIETLIAKELKSNIPKLQKSPAKEIKKWFKAQDYVTEFKHRHYIVDNEYIPFDKTANDKEKYINDFLNSEIDYEIIQWQEYKQLGYEILPNKYFYKYEEPESSDSLIEDFWQLEKDAEKLLNDIRNL